MPSISHKVLHGRVDILRALSRAGQFAHADPEAMGASLDVLYNINLRLDWLRRARDRAEVAEHAAPMVLVKAAESGLLAGGHFDASAVGFIRHEHGVTCSLCIAVEASPHTPYGIPSGFMTYVCPNFLRVEGDRTTPFCNACHQAITSRLWREHGAFPPADAPHLWNSILAWLPTSRAFVKRVRDNASNLERLRFDPRRVVRWSTKL